MSILPLLQELIDVSSRPSLVDLYDQNFGLGLLNDDVLHPTRTYLLSPLRCGYLRPWRNSAVGDSGVSTVNSTKDGLKINLDVQQFQPEELKVSVSDGFIVVEGKHEERPDQHGFIMRQFTRRYKIPENINETALVSSLSSDGVLILKAPLKALPEAKSREIPITQTNQPALKPTAHEGAGEKIEA